MNLLDYLDQNADKKIACYGAGRYGHEVLGYLFSKNITPKTFVVTNPMRRNSKLGVPIVTVEEVEDFSQYIWLVCVSDIYQEEIVNTLKKKGVDNPFLITEEVLSEIRLDAICGNNEIRNSANKNRCFILCTGPSTMTQDLSLLALDDVFSCSYSNLMTAYDEIAPLYYVSPSAFMDFGDDYEWKDDFALDALRYMDKYMSSQIFFLDYYDRAYVEYLEAFKGKSVFYICQTIGWNEHFEDYYDLTKETPGITTASIMMLKAAIYCGYKEIYLLGTEHDLERKCYQHAYDYSRLKDLGFERLYNIRFNNNENINKDWSRRKLLRISAEIYEQYYQIHCAAKELNVKIYNATAGGSLDEFPRVKFESLF